MDTLFWLYWFTVLAVAASAWTWGAWPERGAAGMVLVASALNFLVVPSLPLAFLAVNWPLFAIDLALFASLLWLSFKADRWWTFVACGTQLASVLGHLVKLLGSMISPFAYSFLNTLWSYVVLAAIVAGIVMHHRRASRRGPAPSSPNSSGR